MELDDCAFPLLAGITCSDDPNIAFADADYALLVGARPRGPGMERKDLLEANAAIFSAQGKAMNAVASRGIKVLVVGNPQYKRFDCHAQRTGYFRQPVHSNDSFDHNRAITQIAQKTGVVNTDVTNMTIWGNHSRRSTLTFQCTNQGAVGHRIG